MNKTVKNICLAVAFIAILAFALNGCSNSGAQDDHGWWGGGGGGGAPPAPGAPTVSGLNPTNFAAGQTVTIIDTDFGTHDAASDVNVGNMSALSVSRAIVSWADTEIQFTAPSAFPFEGNVTVTTSIGTSNAFPYTRKYAWRGPTQVDNNTAAFVIPPNVGALCGDIDKRATNPAGGVFTYVELNAGVTGLWSRSFDAAVGTFGPPRQVDANDANSVIEQWIALDSTGRGLCVYVEGLNPPP